MSLEATIIAIVLTGSVVLFVLMPIFENRADDEDTPAARRGTARQRQSLETLWAEKLRVMRQIRDLDFDYDMHKLTAAMYETQRVYLFRLAAAITRRIDELDAEIDAQQARVEQAVAALRQARQA